MIKTFSKIDKVVLWATRIFAIFSFVAIIFMMVFITADVVGRTFFNTSIKGTYEIVEVAMGTSVFTVLAYTEAMHGHVHVTLIIGRFPAKVRIFFYALTSLLTTVLIGVAAYAAIKQVGISAASNQITAVMKIPYAYLYSMLAASMIVFCITLAYSSVKAVAAIFNAEVQAEVESHWS